MKHILISALVLSASLSFFSSSAFAHCGGHSTGHHNRNYTNGCSYYCGGNPAHLHINGACPYNEDCGVN